MLGMFGRLTGGTWEDACKLLHINGFNHQEAVITIRIVLVHPLDGHVAQLIVQALRSHISNAHFESDRLYASIAKTALNFMHH